MPCINNAEAKRILEQLFEGINPLTGEYFPKQHVYNDPNVIRALYTAVNALNACTVTPTMRSASEQTEKCISSIHANRNKSWTPEEDQNLRHAHGYGATYDQMAAQLLRSPRLIKSDLCIWAWLQEKSQDGPAPLHIVKSIKSFLGILKKTRRRSRFIPTHVGADSFLCGCLARPAPVHPHARGAD